MKKVLLRGPILTKSGYGQHFRQIARWFFENQEKYDLDISCESLPWGVTGWMVNRDDEFVQKVLQCAQRQHENYDISVQLQLPNEWNPFAADYNIGVTAGVETDMCNPEWVHCINKMDLVIVPSEFTRQTFLNSGEVKTKIVVIGESFNQLFLKPDDVKPFAGLDNLESDFNFLVVGQVTGYNAENDRKNLFYTVKWFSEVFNGMSDVGLVIKTNGARNTKIDLANCKNIFESVLTELKYNGTPKFYMIHGDLTDEEMVGLYKHPKIKAFLTLTKGEGFCGLETTPIITKNGLKKLSEMEINDEVLTHTGNWKKVTKTMSRNYEGDMVTLKPYNASFENVTLTPNHNIYIFDKKTETYNWKPVGEITKDDCLCIPIPKRTNVINKIDLFDFIDTKDNLIFEENFISFKNSNGTGFLLPRNLTLTNDLGRLIGYYFAEGCVSGSEIHFSLNKNEKDTLAKDIISLMKKEFKIEKFSIKEFEVNNKLILTFNSTTLSYFLNFICNGKAREKKLNEFLYTHAPQHFIDGFLAGLFLGDGYLSDEEISIELGSKEAIRQIRMLLLEKGIVGPLNSQRRVGEIKGHHYDNDYYRFRITNIKSYNLFVDYFNENNQILTLEKQKENNITQGRMKYFVHNENIIYDIKTIEYSQHKGKVYNISVEEDESYCTENFMVHNCIPALDAAAAGLPVIATDWSAHTEYLNLGKWIKVNATVDKIHPTRVDNQIFFENFKWAYPKEQDAKIKMMKFYQKPQIPTEWAKDLSKTIKERYSHEFLSKQYDEVFSTILVDNQTSQ